MIRQLMLVSLAVGSLSSGPPRVEVVHRGLPAGVLARIETHVHVELKDAIVAARVVTTTNGALAARPLAMHTIEAAHRYEIRGPGAAGTGHLVVVTVEQGPEGKHGVAEAVIAVDAAGRIREVTYPTGRWHDMRNAPRRATDRELAEALGKVGG